MKMIKRIGILAFIVMMLIPTSNVFALTSNVVLNGTFDDGTGETAFDGEFDRNYQSGYNIPLNRTRTITFSEPLKIDGHIIAKESEHLEYEYYDSTGSVVKSGNITSTANEDVQNFDTISDITKVTFKSVDNTGNSAGHTWIWEIQINVISTEDTTPPGEVTELNQGLGGQYSDDLGVSFTPPSDSDYSGVQVYINGEGYFSSNTVPRIATAIYSADFVYGDVIKVITFDSSGNESNGKTITLVDGTDRDGDGIPDSEDEYPDDPTNTPPPVGEVTDLEIDSQFDRVDLSWTLPESERLSHVNIYRDEIVETTMLQKLFGVSVAHAATTEIFETNGTSFNDLTVEEETEYEYTVTTTDTDGVESPGVTSTTGTPAEPIVDLRDMELPFGIGELIISGNELLGLVGYFVLAALSFVFTPKIIELIKWTMWNRKVSKERKKLGLESNGMTRDFKNAFTMVRHEEAVERESNGKSSMYTRQAKREQRNSRREKGIKRDEHGNRIHFQSKESKAHLEKHIKEMKPPRSRFQRPKREPKPPRESKRPKREPKQERQPRKPRKGRRSN